MSITKETIQIVGPPLIKFQSRERIESLQKGHLYANTLGYYRKLEEETGDNEIGDKFEAMIHVNEAIINMPDTHESIHLNDDLISTTHSNDYVFCMFTIYPNMETFSFTDKQKEKMLSFGDTALIIKDKDEFVKRVSSAAKAATLDVYFDAVNYFDPSVDNLNMIVSLMKSIWNIAFWKRDIYRFQQEARFVFMPNDGSDHIELDIGDITDISEIVPANIALNAFAEKHK